jgi:uncharacterized protein (TIGR02145 family)
MKKQLLLIISLVLINQTTFGQVVTIGTQIWQTTNLDVTTYRDGTPIPQVSDPTQWSNLTTGAWCYNNNNSANGAIYGKLYNWYAVAGIHDNDPNTPNKILAPTGWHVPSDAEWITLINYLDPNANGGSTSPNNAGGKLKSTSNLWFSPNTAATNSSGFIGLPAGWRNVVGGFLNIGASGDWWSLSEANTTNAWGVDVNYLLSDATRGNYGKNGGLSVRCISGDSPLTNTIFDANSIKLYPNPVVRVLNVSIDQNLINQAYSIIDGLGRVVLNGKLNELDTSINLEQLSRGIYYLKVSENKAIKFIKY